MKEKLSTILDVGCRYGVFDLFKKNISLLDLHMVDVDKDEINRLKKKYKKFNNIKFYNYFLTKDSNEVDVNFSLHKGYISSKKINPNSIWFSLIRKNEKKITKVLNIKAIKSKDFFNKLKKNISVIKLDVEGSELDFLLGLENKINEVKAFVLESHFDNPYINGSGFDSTHKYLLNKGFFLASMKLNVNRINIFHNKNDSLPLSANTVYLKKNFLRKASFDEIKICYLLNLSGIMFDIIKKDYKIILKNKKNIFFNPIKKYIGLLLKQKQNEPYFNYKKANNIFFRIFNQKLPALSDFYSDDFFNS
jgi:FkbM family methyltransferase